jgi:hypothetical protein
LNRRLGFHVRDYGMRMGRRQAGSRDGCRGHPRPATHGGRLSIKKWVEQRKKPKFADYVGLALGRRISTLPLYLENRFLAAATRREAPIARLVVRDSVPPGLWLVAPTAPGNACGAASESRAGFPSHCFARPAAPDPIPEGNLYRSQAQAQYPGCVFSVIYEENPPATPKTRNLPLLPCSWHEETGNSQTHGQPVGCLQRRSC